MTYRPYLNIIAQAEAALDGRITAIENDVNSLEGRVSQNEQDILDLQNDISTINTTISGIQGTISTIQGDISAIQGNVSTLQGQVSTLQGQVSTLQTDFSTLSNDLNVLEQIVNILESEVDQNTLDITDLQNSLVLIDNTLDSLQTQIDALSQSDTVPALAINVPNTSGSDIERMTVISINQLATIEPTDISDENISFGNFAVTQSLLEDNLSGFVILKGQLKNADPANYLDFGAVYLMRGGRISNTLPNIGAGAESVILAQADFFEGQINGMTDDIRIERDSLSFSQDKIIFSFDGVETIEDVIDNWNLNNPSNTVSLIFGDDTQVPDNGEQILLNEGHYEIPESFAFEEGDAILRVGTIIPGEQPGQKDLIVDLKLIGKL
jgi:archaellum component FlaC